MKIVRIKAVWDENKTDALIFDAYVNDEGIICIFPVFGFAVEEKYNLPFILRNNELDWGGYYGYGNAENADDFIEPSTLTVLEKPMKLGTVITRVDHRKDGKEEYIYYQRMY